ncbi:Synaptotagmin-like protein 5 [Amphibalanus amphitrite]|uniref:Synaptotagmin-like protein 5 n=1 Tax=Amphibalanus amphitrite TaxID=1232801 RepID=A0A6A4VJN6_AMPAM|nr:Synaptotagmin-like protein 5 [Amphibalanus amphitrite]
MYNVSAESDRQRMLLLSVRKTNRKTNSKTKMAVSDVTNAAQLAFQDLNLTSEEQQRILDVIERDEALRREEKIRIWRLKSELQMLRLQGVLRPGQAGGRTCARCRVTLGRIFNRGAPCRSCRLTVCKDCRQQPTGGRGWVCTVCHKQMFDVSEDSSEVKVEAPRSRSSSSGKSHVGGSRSPSRGAVLGPSGGDSDSDPETEPESFGGAIFQKLTVVAGRRHHRNSANSEPEDDHEKVGSLHRWAEPGGGGRHGATDSDPHQIVPASGDHRRVFAPTDSSPPHDGDSALAGTDSPLTVDARPVSRPGSPPGRPGPVPGPGSEPGVHDKLSEADTGSDTGRSAEAAPAQHATSDQPAGPAEADASQPKTAEATTAEAPAAGYQC